MNNHIKTVLKINGSLSAPFKVQRGVREGRYLSGMLYPWPLLLKLRLQLAGVNFSGCEQVFKLSAHTDGVNLIKKQDDVNGETVDSALKVGLRGTLTVF